MEYLIYRVRKGEKAEDVARKTGVAARRICALNNCRKEQIEVGVRLLIAQAEGREYSSATRSASKNIIKAQTATLTISSAASESEKTK